MGDRRCLSGPTYAGLWDSNSECNARPGFLVDCARSTRGYTGHCERTSVTDVDRRLSSIQADSNRLLLRGERRNFATPYRCDEQSAEQSQIQVIPYVAVIPISITLPNVITCKEGSTTLVGEFVPQRRGSTKYFEKEQPVSFTDRTNYKGIDASHRFGVYCPLPKVFLIGCIAVPLFGRDRI